MDKQNSEKSPDIKPIFIDKLPLPVSFVIIFLGTFLFFVLVFFLVGYISFPSLMNDGGGLDLLGEMYPLFIILSVLVALFPLPTLGNRRRHFGYVKGESSVIEVLGNVFAVIILLGILWLLFSLFSCSSPRSSSNSIDYSERAQELGTSTEEYTDAYNYWKYDNP